MLSANGIEQSISGTKIRSIRNHYEFMIFNRLTSLDSIRKKGLLLMMLPIFQSVGKNVRTVRTVVCAKGGENVKNITKYPFVINDSN